MHVFPNPVTYINYINYLYINFAVVNPVTYHSLYGFAVGTRMVLQVLWEFPIPGMENTLSMT